MRSPENTRRRFLKHTTAGTVAVLSGFVQPRRVLAQTTLSADAALEDLMAGNRRFVAGRLSAFDQDLTILKQHTAEKQEPFAAVLSCVDSRVPVDLIFDQSIGHIFVARVAGNVVTSEIVASLEYGVAVLGIKLILVMGHANCGAVKATMKTEGAPGQISALYPHIQPAVDQAGTDLDLAVRTNTKMQAALLRKASTVIAGPVKQNTLKVIAAHYDMASGTVTLLD
jgi:carbonic anhydrase